MVEAVFAELLQQFKGRQHVKDMCTAGNPLQGAPPNLCGAIVVDRAGGYACLVRQHVGKAGWGGQGMHWGTRLGMAGACIATPHHGWVHMGTSSGFWKSNH